MVVDEGVAVMGVWLACHTSPGHTPLAALAPLSPGERGGCGLVGRPVTGPGILREGRLACSLPSPGERGVDAVDSARREGTGVLVVWLIGQV